MSRTLVTIISALLVATALTQCPQNCGSCGTKDNQAFCFVCQGGFKWQDGKCDVQQEDPNCEFHSAAGCLGCKAGFYMDMDKQTCIAAAAGKAIANCIVGLVNQGAYQCQVCAKSYPNDKQTACSIAIKAADNCVNGTVDDYYKPSCMLCTKGFVSYNGKCVASPLDSCMYANTKGQCVQCKDGYFMKFSGVCAQKTGDQIETVQTVDM